MEGNLARKQEGREKPHSLDVDMSEFDVPKELPAESHELKGKKSAADAKAKEGIAQLRKKLKMSPEEKQAESERVKAELEDTMAGISTDRMTKAEQAEAMADLKEMAAAVPKKEEPKSGYEVHKEIEEAKLTAMSDAIAHDEKYYATVGARLTPGEANSYRSLDQELLLVNSQIEKAGFFQKFKLNRQKAKLEKEIEPYWDKIQLQDEFAILKKGSPEGKKKSWGNEYLDSIAAMDITGFDMDTFAGLTEKSEALERDLEDAEAGKLEVGWFKKRQMKSDLAKVMKDLRPFQDDIQRGGGRLSEKSDLKLSGRVRL